MKNYAGFTLLECLITLALTMGLLIFVTPFITFMKRMEVAENNRDYIELQVGKKQLDFEITKLKFKEIEAGKLLFYDTKQMTEKSVVMFEQYEDMLRKTPGHQPLIIQLKEVSFEEHEKNIQMNITLIGGGKFVYFLDKGGL